MRRKFKFYVWCFDRIYVVFASAQTKDTKAQAGLETAHLSLLGQGIGHRDPRTTGRVECCLHQPLCPRVGEP